MPVHRSLSREYTLFILESMSQCIMCQTEHAARERRKEGSKKVKSGNSAGDGSISRFELVELGKASRGSATKVRASEADGARVKGGTRRSRGQRGLESDPFLCRIILALDLLCRLPSNVLTCSQEPAVYFVSRAGSFRSALNHPPKPALVRSIITDPIS